mmetsp:Transcript_20440/g.28755  ORF Transcript_20440/g.28755 Transcript_20440/m.28755 type:complete len:577 (-) Transcript_20440:176-1906(-)
MFCKTKQSGIEENKRFFQSQAIMYEMVMTIATEALATAGVGCDECTSGNFAAASREFRKTAGILSFLAIHQLPQWISGSNSNHSNNILKNKLPIEATISNCEAFSLLFLAIAQQMAVATVLIKPGTPNYSLLSKLSLGIAEQIDAFLHTTNTHQQQQQQQQRKDKSGGCQKIIHIATEKEDDTNLTTTTTTTTTGTPQSSTTSQSSSLSNNNNNNSNNNNNLFIAEGTETTRLMIQNHKKYNLISILIKPSSLLDPPVQLIQDLRNCCSNFHDKYDYKENYHDNDGNDHDSSMSLPFHILVAREETMTLLVGFPVSRGAMSCGHIPQRDGIHWLRQFLFQQHDKCCHRHSHPVPHSAKDHDSNSNSNANNTPQTTRILALDRISDTANMGSLLRTAACFGISVVILGPGCCDAWYRRSVRVSMGHVLTVPTVRVDNLEETLMELDSHFGIGSYASVVDMEEDDDNNHCGNGKTLVLENIPKGTVGCHFKGNYCQDKDKSSTSSSNNNNIDDDDDDERVIQHKAWCVVLGNEANGISNEVIKACTMGKLHVGIVPEVDSLSVGVAAGILLHGLRERE